MFDLITLILAAVFFIFIGFRPPWQTKKGGGGGGGGDVNPIPGPVAVPLIGTTWLFTFGGYKLTEIPAFYRDMYRKYGGVVKEEALFNVPVIHVFEKRDIEKVLRSTGKYPVRPPTEALAQYRREHPERYASTGLTNEQGEKWHYLRTSLTPTLTSPKTIHDFLPEMEQIADDWCHLIRTHRATGNGLVADLQDLAGKLGLETTCALVLGRRMGFLLEDRKCETADQLAAAVQQQFTACRDTYYGFPFWKLFQTDAYERLCASESAIYELASDLIRTADDSTRDSAVFRAVLRADIDEREKKSAIVDFLAAGIHTLKNSLLFLLYQVAAARRCQRKIREDATKAYLKACVLETFRVCPTADSLARVSETDLQLSGYHVNAGSVIVCHTAHACLNDDNFRNAAEFLPERWLNEDRAETMASAAFLLTPFGYGRRICPGKRFMEQVLPIVLDRIVETFEIEAIAPLQVEFQFLIAPKGPLSMRFKDRV